MKIVKRIPTRSSRPIPNLSTTETAERIKALTPLALEQWYDEHRPHKAERTWAYLGLRWDSCPYYHHVTCGCGSVVMMYREGSEVIITQGEPIGDVFRRGAGAIASRG